jgi:hypothetical protein
MTIFARAKSLAKKAGAAFGALLLAPSVALAQSAPADIGDLADTIDFGDVGSAVLAVAAAIIGILVLFKGCQFLYRAIRGG